MRSITAFTLGVLASAGACFVVVHAPWAHGEDCPPAKGAMGGTTAAAEGAPTAPKKEPAIASAFLKGLVGEWGCDCAVPAEGTHASGKATARLVLDGTALVTETHLDWSTKDKKEPIQSMGVWKVGADGKSLTYWGFSSHDKDVDHLTGELTDTSATVSGITGWGPMRMTLTMKDGALSQQLWIEKQDMGTITYKKQ
jgi:hypothetical protein